MKSKSVKILSLLFAFLMIFEHIAFANSTVDLFNDDELKSANKTKNEVLSSDKKTVDILDNEPPKTVDILNPESVVGDKKEETEVKPKENKVPKTGTIDIITEDMFKSTEINAPTDPEKGKNESQGNFSDGLVDISNYNKDENFENKKEVGANENVNAVDESRNPVVENEEHTNAGTLPWHTDLTKPWSLYRAPKKVYRPGDDLDLSELLVEIKTGRSGSLYNIADILDDEFAKIYRVRKSDGSRVGLSDKIMEDELLTIHMDGCEDINIDLSVDENLKNQEEGYEAFQYNLISAMKESLSDRLDFSLYIIGKGEARNPKIAYSLDPLKMSPLGHGEEGSLTEGELYNKKEVISMDRYDKETLGKVKNALIKSEEFRFKDSIRYKLVTQLAIWNITSNLLPEEVVKDKESEINNETNIEETPEQKDITDENLKEVLKTKEIVSDDKKEEIKSDVESDVEVEPKVLDDKLLKENENDIYNQEIQKIKTVRFNTSEFDIPYNMVELTEEEYSLYKTLTEVEPLTLEDDKFEIYEPLDNSMADLVTYGVSDLEKINRIDKNITFDVVDYRFKSVFEPATSYSMLGFGQVENTKLNLFAHIRASRKIKSGDKLNVEILSEYNPVFDNETGRPKDIKLNDEVVATAEFNSEENKIVYTFNKDLDVDEVDLEQDFEPKSSVDTEYGEEDNAIRGLLSVSSPYVMMASSGSTYGSVDDMVRGASYASYMSYSSNNESSRRAVNSNKKLGDLRLVVGNTNLVGRANGGPSSDLFPAKIPYYSYQEFKNGLVKWNIEVDARLLKQDNLDFNNVVLSLYAPTNQGLTDYQISADENIVKDSSSQSDENFVMYSGKIPKNLIPQNGKIKISVSARPVVYARQYSLGLRVNTDKNYVVSLLDRYKNNYNELKKYIPWIIPFLNKGKAEIFRYGLNLIDTRITLDLANYAFGVNEDNVYMNPYHDNTRSIVAKFNGKTIDWQVSDTLRTEDIERNYRVPNINSINLYFEHKDRNQQAKRIYSRNAVYYIPLQNGKYEKRFNYTEIPGTIVVYNLNSEKPIEGKNSPAATLSVYFNNKSVDVNAREQNQGGNQVAQIKRSNQNNKAYHIGYYEVKNRRQWQNMPKGIIFKVIETGEYAYCINHRRKNPVNFDIFNTKIDINSGSDLENYIGGTGNNPNEMFDRLKRVYYYFDKYVKDNNIDLINDEPMKQDIVSAKQAAIFDSVGQSGEDFLKTGYIGNSSGDRGPRSNAIYRELTRIIDAKPAWNNKKASGVKLRVLQVNKLLFQNVIVGDVETPVSILKVDEKGEVLKGARFEILDKSGKGVEAWNSLDVKTELMLSPGEYTLREVKAPQGYKKISDVKFVVYKETKTNPIKVIRKRGEVDDLHDSAEKYFTNKITLVGDVSKEDVGQVKLSDDGMQIVVLNKKSNKVIIKKVDENSNPISGAVFGLFNTDGTEFKINGRQVVATSGQDGLIEFLNLPVGEYIIKEIQAPDGYEKIDSEIIVSVNEDNEVTIKKSKDDSNNIKLPGDIEDNSNKEKADETKDNIKIFDIKNIMSSPNSRENLNWKADYLGSRDIGGDKVESKTRIYLNPSNASGPKNETRLVIDYKKAQDIRISLYRIPANKKHLYGKNDSIPSEYKKLNSIDDDRKKLTLDYLPELNGDEVVIDVTTEFNRRELDKTISSSWETYDGSGKLQATLGELSYEMNREPTPVVNREVKAKPIVVVNKKKTNKIRIKKVDEEGKTLSGAKFGLFKENGEQLVYEGKPVEAIVNEEGYAEFRDVDEGRYIIKETYAPEGYELSTERKLIVVERDAKGNLIPKLLNKNVTIKNGQWNYTNYVSGGYSYKILGFSSELVKTNNEYELKIHFKRFLNNNAYYNYRVYFDTENFEVNGGNFNSSVGYAYDSINANKQLGDGVFSYNVRLKNKDFEGKLSPIKSLTFSGVTIDQGSYPTISFENEALKNKDENILEFEFVNKLLKRNVSFVKIGKNNDVEKTLKGAEFELLVKNNEVFEKLDPEVKAVSDDNGKLEFNDLKPGEYQIVELKTPHGYRPVTGPIKEFRINLDGTIEIKTSNGYVTKDDSNSKIVNESLGNGKFRVKKTDENRKSLEGVKFELRNINGELVDTKITDKNGEIEFKDLPNGKYFLREVKSVDGYIVDKREFPIFIGEKWEVPNDREPRKDVSNLLEVDDDASSIKSTLNDKNIVNPNKSEGIKANLTYKIKDAGNINPGDYFTLNLSENLDLDGIDISPDTDFNIMGPSGLVAVAKIGDDRRSIKYTFTNYVKNYTLDNIQISINMFVNRLLVKNDSNIRMVITVGESAYIGNINVKYSGYADKNVHLNAYMTKLNPQNHKFTALVYVNPWNENSYNKKLIFKSLNNVSINSVETYSVNEKLPESYGIDFTRMNGLINRTFYKDNDRYIVYLPGTQFNNYYNTNTYLVKIDGVVNNDVKNLAMNYWYSRKIAVRYGYRALNVEPKDDYWQTWSEFYYPSGSAEGSLVITNRKNRIEFIKLEGAIKSIENDSEEDKPKINDITTELASTSEAPLAYDMDKKLKGVEFELRKDGSVIENSKQVSDENGKFSWEGLSKGKYEVWETKQLPGFKLPTEAVSSFEVNEDGEIINIKNNTTIIVNEKEDTDIEFTKVDSKNHQTTLKDAEFTLFKQFEADGQKSFDAIDRDGNKVDDISKAYKVTSADDGKIKFEKLKDGFYAVKETKAPAGYQRPSDYVYRFEVKEGKVYKLDDKFNRVNKDNAIDKENKDVYPINIENKKVEYPQTGGVGSIIFTIVGLTMMLVATFVLNKREECYE